MIPFIWQFGKGNIIEIENILMVARGLVWGKGELQRGLCVSGK